MPLTKVSYSMITGAPVNILDFGADPTGVANSSPAIQAAINSLPSGGAIYCPTGTYLLDSTITFPESDYFKFYGDGSIRTIFTFDGTGNAIEAASNTSNRIRVHMEGFLLQLAGGNTTATNGIFMKNCQYSSDLVDIWVEGFRKAGTQTIDGYTFYYSGIVAMYSWGLCWRKVECRSNGNGMTLIQFNSTILSPNCLNNDQNGLYLWDGVTTVVGGVFQGNDAANNSNASSTVANAELVCLGGNSTIDGVYFEGEGVNPPWTIIVDGTDANNRSSGTKIVNCNITRSSDTAKVRECIYVRYAEETVIEGNTITPTAVDGTAAAAISHIKLFGVSLNTRIGHNSYRGRHWGTGVLYSWLPKIINTSGLPAYNYPFASNDGGLKTVQKRLRLEHYYASPTANMAATAAPVPGTIVNRHNLTRLVWLTNVQALVANSLSAGTFTVKVYNIEATGGGPVLIGTYQSSGTGERFELLNQHPYQTLLLQGLVYCTVETDVSFAPTASQAIYIELEFEEFDNH